ncbi:uncharacterized protein LOC131051337 [Cryptomeria japonica]|uniref:uncharacterized protein LOC131051337 n=1 Tax=Cryptomeria japonica TaxID=3369 RepID=UPI0025ABFC1F|nr:uncharacterized protein LOC131051337 [Cryptomeria japonica]
MRKGKAPGSDGFPIEFFQEFWDIINLDFLEVVRESLERLKICLPSLISEEQGGFVARRQILDGVVVASEAIRSVATSKEKSMFIKLDMAKAYDRVKWGLRQGDPLSSYSFIIMADSLGRFLKSQVSHGIIQGWSWGNGLSRFSHLQFLDDTALMGIAHLREPDSFTQVLDIYLATSSQKVNEHKSFIFFFNTPEPFRKGLLIF